MILSLVFQILRAAVLAATVLTLAIALTDWAVRAGHLTPFHWWTRLMRRVGDPLTRPVERRLAPAGGDPRTAPWWLLAFTLLGGLLTLSIAQWLVNAGYTVHAAFSTGPTGVAAMVLGLAYDTLILALAMRVVGTWFGIGRWTRWMRPAYQITDWIVMPLSRVIPPLGAVDLSPLAAWLALWVARGLLLRLIL